MHQDAPRSGPAAMPRGEHRPQFDGLRFLAFLGVFLFHINLPRYAAGSLGVPLFFVLSGFLITRILLRNEGSSLAADLGAFYARRTLRILPLYYAVLLVLRASGGLEHPASSFLYVYNFSVYWGWQPVGNVGHFWTLAVEEQFYLAFPLVLLATPRRFRLGLLAALLLGGMASRHALDRLAPSPFTYMLPNIAGEYLIAGAIAGFLDVRRPGVPASTARFLGAASLSCFLGLWISGVELGTSWLGFCIPELIALAFSVLVWELWRCQGWTSRVLGCPPLAYLGKISYGCYVYHLFAIQNNAWLIEALHLSAIPGLLRVRSLVALVATIVVSILSWHLFESPILSLKSRFEYARTRPEAVPSAPARTSASPTAATA